MVLNDADRELMDLQRSMSASGAGIAGLPSGAAVAADPEVIRTWELRRAAQAEGYGQFVADGDIYIGNCLTFANGQQVPLEHVIRYQLDERHQVNRIATPELARLGKTFETDEEFLEANPRHAENRRAMRPAGELHPSALDPRGGGAAIDDARKRGETVDAPLTDPEAPERREAAADQAQTLAHTDAGDTGDDDKAAAKSSKPRSGSRSSGSDKTKEGE